MTNDRELLELAAKAAGLMIHEERQAERDALIGPEKAGLCIVSVSTWWNPLTNDADALRLAVKLRMVVDTDYNGGANAGNAAVDFGEPEYGYQEGQGKTDPLAATRRAIVRAAAEIRKEMK